MRRIATGLVLSVLAVPGLAAGVLYDCDITRKSNDSNFIADKMAFVVPEDGAVSVLDQNILYYKKEALPVQVRKPRADLMRMKWHLTAATSVSGQIIPTVAYQADLDTAKSQVTVYAQVAGYPVRVRGTGGCKMRKQ